MPTYIVLVRLTAKAKSNLAESRAQRDKVWGEFQKQGMKFTGYLTMGPFDAVNVIESPSEELMVRFLMTAGATGQVETTTMRAFTSAEADRIATP